MVDINSIKTKIRNCSGDSIEYGVLVYIKDNRYMGYKGSADAIARFIFDNLENPDIIIPNNICALREFDSALDGWLRSIEKGKNGKVNNI